MEKSQYPSLTGTGAPNRQSFRLASDKAGYDNAALVSASFLAVAVETREAGLGPFLIGRTQVTSVPLLFMGLMSNTAPMVLAR
jgi:hypothetical protein